MKIKNIRSLTTISFLGLGGALLYSGVAGAAEATPDLATTVTKAAEAAAGHDYRLDSLRQTGRHHVT